MDKVNKEFPVLRRAIYVNTPVYGAISDRLLEWRQEHDLDFLLRGSEMRQQSLAVISDARTAVGDFFGCTRNNVALVTNFSSGLNMFLAGLDKNLKVLLLDNDYPSLAWPFESWGFEIVRTEINENLEATIKEVVAKEKIAILALSVVQWQSGIMIDLNFLKRLKQAHPNLIIIGDGTQFLGTTNFNFQDSAFDVLGASGYKWLLAGYGNGFMLFKDKVADFCDIRTIGFNAASTNFENKNTIPFARRFEPGHLACLNFGSLKFSLEFLTKIGKDKIEKQNKNLSEKAKLAFEELGLLSEAVVRRKMHSTIFNIKGDERLFNHLIENNVVCAQRGDGIRMGFHFYNTQNELDTIIEIIKRAP